MGRSAFIPPKTVFTASHPCSQARIKQPSEVLWMNGRLYSGLRRPKTFNLSSRFMLPLIDEPLCYTTPETPHL